MKQLETTTKYLAIASIWLAVGIVGYRDPLTIIYGALLGLVATAIIIYNN